VASTYLDCDDAGGGEDVKVFERVVFAAKSITTGFLCGCIALVIDIHLLDWTGQLIIGPMAVRAVWSDGHFAGWVPEIWGFGGLTGALFGLLYVIVRGFQPRRWSMFVPAVLAWAVTATYIYFHNGGWIIDGDPYNISLTSLGFITGLLFDAVDRKFWPALTWIATTRMGARA
jgi:hypothetical protein